MQIQNPETEEESELLTLRCFFRCEILHLGKLQQPLTFQVFVGLLVHHIPTGVLVFLLE